MSQNLKLKLNQIFRNVHTPSDNLFLSTLESDVDTTRLLDPLKNISPNILKKCAQAVKTASQKPPIPVDESSIETVDFTNHYMVDSTDFGNKLETTSNPLNLVAKAATTLVDTTETDMTGGCDRVIEPKIAAEGNSNNNNDVPTEDIPKEAVDASFF